MKTARCNWRLSVILMLKTSAFLCLVVTTVAAATSINIISDNLLCQRTIPILVRSTSVLYKSTNVVHAERNDSYFETIYVRWLPTFYWDMEIVGHAEGIKPSFMLLISFARVLSPCTWNAKLQCNLNFVCNFCVISNNSGENPNRIIEATVIYRVPVQCASIASVYVCWYEISGLACGSIISKCHILLTCAAPDASCNKHAVCCVHHS